MRQDQGRWEATEMAWTDATVLLAGNQITLTTPGPEGSVIEMHGMKIKDLTVRMLKSVVEGTLPLSPCMEQGLPKAQRRTTAMRSTESTRKAEPEDTEKPRAKESSEGTPDKKGTGGQTGATGHTGSDGQTGASDQQGTDSQTGAPDQKGRDGQEDPPDETLLTKIFNDPAKVWKDATTLERGFMIVAAVIFLFLVLAAIYGIYRLTKQRGQNRKRHHTEPQEVLPG